jgi:hypothetical protein
MFAYRNPGVLNEDHLPSDSGYDTYIDTDISAQEGTDSDDTEWGGFSDTEVGSDSDPEYESDSSSVTDDGYLAGNEETRTILWRHIDFSIIRSPIAGRRHILVAIVTLLHTKGEDRKPRM